MFEHIRCRILGHKWVRARGSIINPKCSRCGTFKIGKNK